MRGASNGRKHGALLSRLDRPDRVVSESGVCRGEPLQAVARPEPSRPRR
jgi:hypothetical protein